MAKIIKPEDAIPVHPVLAILYGSPGVGKTTLAQTAAPQGKLLTIDAEMGIGRAAKGVRKDVVQVESYKDILDLCGDKTLDQYQTIVIDSMTGMMHKIIKYLLTIKKKDKKGNDLPYLAYVAYGGSGLSMQGYGELKCVFEKVYMDIAGGRRDVIIIAHDKEVGQGDDSKSQFDIAGSSKNFINQNAHAIGRVYKSAGKHLVDFNGDSEKGYLGKNVQGCLGGSNPIEIPDAESIGLFLQSKINGLKRVLCSVNDKAAENSKKIKEWSEKLALFKTTDDFNEFGLVEVKDFAPEIIVQAKTMLNDAAIATGLKYDKEIESFFMPEKEIVETAQQPVAADAAAKQTKIATK